MPAPKTLQSARNFVMRNVLTWAMPRLVELPPSRWDEAVRNARNINFDTVERIGIIVGVVFVAYLHRVRRGIDMEIERYFKQAKKKLDSQS